MCVVIQPDVPFKTPYATLDIIMRLCENTHNSDRNIKSDNLYKRIPLAEEKVNTGWQSKEN